MKDPKLMDHIMHLHMVEGRTALSLSREYGISPSAISDRKKKLQAQAKEDERLAKELATMELNRKLKEENEELKKEADFLKKAAVFFAKDQK